jgi:hypothetical protein
MTASHKKKATAKATASLVIRPSGTGEMDRRSRWIGSNGAIGGAPR